MRFSRIQNQFLALMLSLALVFTPARQAHAIVPLVAIGVQAVMASGVTLSAVDVAGLAIAAAGMGVLAYFSFTSPDGAAVAVPATPSAVIPPPVASGTVNTITAPSTYCQSHSPSGVSRGCGTIILEGSATATGACLDAGFDFMDGSSRCNCTAGCPYGSPPGAITTLGGAVSCPAGYVLNGSVCTLVDARTAADDNRQDFSRAGNTFAPYSGDQHSMAFSGNSGTTVSSGDSVSLVGTSAGKDTSITVQGLAGGGTFITQTTKEIDSTGANYLKQTVIVLDSTGNIVGTSVNNLTGNLNTSVTAADGGASIEASPPGTLPAVPIAFPTDYNREVTQAQIRDAVIGSGMPVDVAVSDRNVLSNSQTARDAVVVDIDSMPSAPSPVEPVGFSANFHPFVPAACTPLSYSFSSSLTAGSHVVTLDLCPFVPTIQRIGSWAMYLLTAAMLFQMFTRRPEGG